MKNIRVCIDVHQEHVEGVFNVPERYDELTEKQLPEVASIFLDETADKYKRTLKVFDFLTETRQNKAFRQQVQPEEMFDLLMSVDWVFDQVDLRENKFPVIRIRRHKLIGPESGLDNMRFAEWIFADSAFVSYCNTRNEQELDKLIACLYRPAGKGPEYKAGHALYRGDRRERFNDSVITLRERIVSHIPFKIKQAIYLWFASCRQQIIVQYPKVFDAGEEKESNSLLGAFGWFGVYDDLRADPKYAGNATSLEEEYLHTVFQSQTRARIKNDEFKREHGL